MLDQETKDDNKVRFLGHTIRNDLGNNNDVMHQCCKLYGQAHMMVLKCHMCKNVIKIFSFIMHSTVYSAFVV